MKRQVSTQSNRFTTVGYEATSFITAGHEGQTLLASNLLSFITVGYEATSFITASYKVTSFAGADWPWYTFGFSNAGSAEVAVISLSEIITNIT